MQACEDRKLKSAPCTGDNETNSLPSVSLGVSASLMQTFHLTPGCLSRHMLSRRWPGRLATSGPDSRRGIESTYTYVSIIDMFDDAGSSDRI